MPSTELILAFIAATALFAYIPGPSMVYAAAQTLARGRRAGLFAAAGLHVGGYVHVVAAAAGLTAVFHIVPALYLAIKLLGAGYLIWFGAAMIRHALNKKSDLPEVGQTPQKTGQRAFIESVTVEVLNPKTALFFLAFLPQFVDASAAYPLWLQFLILGSIGNLMFLSADLIFIWFAGIIINRLRQSDGLSKALEILGGSIIVVLGLSLLTQHSEI